MALKSEILITAKDRTDKVFDKVESRVHRMGQGFARFGKIAGIGLAGVGAALIAMGKKSLEAADDIGKLSTRLGASTEALSEYRFVADQSGVSFNTLTLGFQRMQRRISEAAQGTGAAKDALIELGLSAESLNQLAPEDQFEIMADALAGVANEGDRTRLAMKLFDTEGVALVQTMEDGAAGIQEMREEARRLGLSLSEDMVKGAEQANDNFNKLFNALKGGYEQALIPLGIGLGDIADLLADLIPKAIAIAVNAFKTLDGWIDNIIQAFENFGTRLKIIFSKVGKQFDDLVYTAQRAWLLIKKAVSFGVVDIEDDLNKLDRSYKVTTAAFINYQKELAFALNDTVDEIGELEEAAAELGQTLDRTNPSVIELTNSIEDLAKADEDAAKKFGGLVDSVQDIEERLDPTIRITREYQQELKILEQYAKETGASVEDLKEKIGKEYVQAMEEATEQTTFLGRAFENLEDLVSQVFENILTQSQGFKEAFVNFVKSIGLSIVKVFADDIAKKVVKVITDVFKGASFNIAEIFNFSGNGSSIGDILGLRNLATSGSKVTEVIKNVGSALGLYTAGTTAAAGATAVLGSGVTGLGANLASTQGALVGLQGAATGLEVGAYSSGVALNVLGAESALAAQAALEGAVALEAFGGAGAAVTTSTTAWGSSLAAAGPYIAAAALGIGVLSGAFSGARSKSEIMRDEFRQLREQMQSGVAETFNLAEGFKAAGSSAALMITGENLAKLQEFLNKIPGINTRLQEIDGTLVLRVLDSMGRGVVELDNLIKGSTGSMGESFAEFSTNAQAGADKLAGTYVGAANDMFKAGENASGKIGDSFSGAADVTELAAGRMETSLAAASESADSKITDFANNSVTNIGRAEGSANQYSSALNAIPDRVTTYIDQIYRTLGTGTGDRNQGQSNQSASTSKSFTAQKEKVIDVRPELRDARRDNASKLERVINELAHVNRKLANQDKRLKYA